MIMYQVVIQDGENVYSEYTTIEPHADYVDGFLRAVKNIIDWEMTAEEQKVLEKFNII